MADTLEWVLERTLRATLTDLGDVVFLQKPPDCDTLLSLVKRHTD